MAIDRGRPDEAIELLERSRASLLARGSVNPAESIWFLDLADALAAAGRVEDALEVVRATLADAERFGEPRPLGLCHLALGRYLHGAEALDHVERAVAVLEPSLYRHDAARARLALGERLRRANRRAEARPHLAGALDYAERNGLAGLAERAAEELRATGARPRRLVLSGVASLTPSESRIARLAAGGMSNREIADHLFVTVKTVEMHLANAFGKLEVGSRRELAGALEAA